VLQNVAGLSRELVGATYSALGVLGANGKLVQFVTSGISQEDRDCIGRLPEGGGVLGVVIRDGMPLRLRNLAEHPQSVGFPPHHPMMKSFLGVPITYKGRVLGDLYLTDKIGAAEFSPDDEGVLTIFASQAAIAIENARLFQIEGRRSAQLNALNRIGRELAGILDLDQLLQRVAELLHESFDYRNVQVSWVTEGSASLQVRAVAGPGGSEVSMGTSRPLDQGISGLAATKQQTVLADDVTQDSGDSGYVAGAGAGRLTELAVPVTVKGKVVAVITVDSTAPAALDESDVTTLETLADQLAVAIQNIQLYHEQREQSRRLAVAEERDRIGRDLHDGVIQSIYAVGLTLEDIAFQAPQEPGEVPPRLEGAVGDLNRVIGDIRGYIMDLRPRELQGRRFDEALETLVKYLEDRTAVSVSLDLSVDLAGLSERYTVNLWHILQEAFSNIEKYAQARQVSLSLEISNGRLNLTIADDGVGFDPEKAELGKGYGLPNIKDRAEGLGGILLIDTSPGKGTRLRVSFPMEEQPTESGRTRRREDGSG
jgi:signal transduction histidine kinase